METLTAQQAAIKLVKAYAIRGDDMNHFRGGGLGTYCDEYQASVGGYVSGKKIPNTKIIVMKVNGEECNELFDLEQIWELAINGIEQPTLL